MKTIEETFAEQLKEFKADILKAVKARFADDKGLDPVVFGLMLHEGKPVLGIIEGLAEFFTSDENKELAAQVIKDTALKIKPLALCFVSEGWASEKPMTEYDAVVDKDGNYREGVVRPIDDPNRKEIILLLFETHDKEAFVQLDIIRNGEEVSLNEVTNTDWEPKKHRAGRFANLLQENYEELAQTIKTNLSNSQN